MKEIKLKKKLSFLILGFLLLLMVSSCDYRYLEIEELPDYELSSEWTLPLLKSKMTINSLFVDRHDQTVIVDSDDLVWLIYEGEVISRDGNIAYNMPDQFMNYNVEFTGAKNSFQIIEEISFQPEEDEELKYISLSSGQMSVLAHCADIVNDQVQVNLVGTILESDDGSGAPLSFTIPVNQSAPEIVDLSGVDLNFGDGQSLSVQIEISIASGTPSSLPYSFSFEQGFSNMDFYEMQGYFGQRSFVLGIDEVDLGFFKNLVEGFVYFENPTIDIIAENSYGIPIDVNFDAFFSSTDDATIDVQGVQTAQNPDPIPTYPWTINGASTPGSSATTEYKVTKDNSNILDVIEVFPSKVSYDVRGESNPAGYTDENHLRYDSNFKVGVKVNLPLHGWLHLAGFRDTLDFELPDAEFIEYLDVLITSVNSMPVTTRLQIDAFDEDDNFLMNITRADQTFILSAEVDWDGNIIREAHNTYEIKLRREDVEAMKNVKYLLFRAIVTSYGDGEMNIKMHSYNELNIFVAMRAGIKETIEFN